MAQGGNRSAASRRFPRSAATSPTTSSTTRSSSCARIQLSCCPPQRLHAPRQAAVDTPEGAKNACGRARKSLSAARLDLRAGRACTHIREQDDWKGALTPRTPTSPTFRSTPGADGCSSTWTRTANRWPTIFFPAKILDPFGLENMRYKWRKWLYFDCNWKVAMEAFNETYRVHHHPEFNKFGEFKGWAKAQGKHSNIGYDAPKAMDETKSKIRLGTSDRISTAEMQVYTMEETNATTTQTLVNAAKRLVDEAAGGHPADKVLSTGSVGAP